MKENFTESGCSNLIRDLFPDELNNRSRFSEIAQRHLKAFRWENQGWIPLGLIVNNPAHSQGIVYNQWLDPMIFLEFQAKVLRDTLEVGSDIMPSISLNHMGNALYTSVFQAELKIPDDILQTTSADIGPWILPVLKDIKEVDHLFPLPIPCGLVKDAEEFMRVYRDNLPEWVRVVSPAKIGPFSLAELLRGSPFYLDMRDDPEHCRQLLKLCTHSLIETERYLRSVVNQSSSDFYSEYGIRGPGLRIGEDSLINISPAMIQEFFLPFIETLAEVFGGKCYVHFCSTDKSRGGHVYKALRNAPCVFAASSQFGFEYYEHHVNQLEGHLAIESLYGDGMKYVTNNYNCFESWARNFVPRFKNRSGLVLYFEVASIEEGKRIWDIWHEAHGT